QILAATAFVGLLAALSFSAYANEMLGIADKMLKDKAVVKKAWLAVLVWIILILWALKELFIA
ncbi:unnamed protein product, partial [marine sediment metagenome]